MGLIINEKECPRILINNIPHNILIDKQQVWADYLYPYPIEGSFVMAGLNKIAFTSDLANWQFTPLTGNWQSIAYNGSRFVAVSVLSSGTQGGVSSSTNLLSWTATNSSTAGGNWYKVIYDNNKFVAVGNSGVIHSSDGLSWTMVSVSPSDGGWRSIAYFNNKWVMIGNSKIAYSTDLTNWTQVNLPASPNSSSSNHNDMAFGKNKCVLIKSVEATIRYTTDLANFASWTDYTESINVRCVRFIDNKFVFCGQFYIGTVTDFPITYPDMKIYYPAQYEWKKIAMGENVYVAAANDAITYSVGLPVDTHDWKFNRVSGTWNDLIYVPTTI